MTLLPKFFMLSLIIGALVLWIWSIIDVIKARFPHDNDKIVWILILLLAPLVGTILYIIIGMDKKIEGPLD